ncbi:MAG: NAD(P)-dependent oxidoreductase [Anaerolineae bacterium]
MPQVIETREIDRKERIKIPHQPYRKQAPEERIFNFDEVYLGYDEEAAKIEAMRCIQCPDPKCRKACLLGNDIAGAMWLISQGQFLEAADLYRQTSTMPEICGRVCPQERLCEGACPVTKRGTPIALGKLEAFVADFQRQTLGGFPVPEVPPPTGKRVAVVGSGPAGLTVAEMLTRKGHAVMVYEKWPRPGGLLVYGIPAFKLKKAIVEEKIAYLERIGVQFVCNTQVGQDLTVDDLLARGFDAVFLGTGANIDATFKAEGTDLDGIYQATDFLVRANLPLDYLPEEMRERPVVGRKVAVIGGGDTAMDCVRTAIRLQAQNLQETEVTCVYRRTEAQMPGSAKERVHAIEEGARFEYLTVPTRFIGDEKGHVVQMECIRMELGEPDRSGRPRPIPIEGSEFITDVDTVVLAIGYWPDPLIGETTRGLETRRWGLIVADEETGQTSRPEIFAGGDNVHGPDLVGRAVAAGMRAARAIDEFLRR